MSLNPLKAGQEFGVGRGHSGSGLDVWVSIPLKRVKNSETVAWEKAFRFSLSQSP